LRDRQPDFSELNGDQIVNVHLIIAWQGVVPVVMEVFVMSMR
jgi:hypothetical protein